MIFKEWDAASKRQSYEYYCYYFWGIIGKENSNKRPQDKGKRSTVTVKMGCLIMQEERKEILSFLPWGKEESQAHTCSLLEAALATQIALLPIPSPDNQAPLSLSLSVSVFLSVSLFLSLFLCLSSLLKSVSSFSCQDPTLLSTMKREAPHAQIQGERVLKGVCSGKEKECMTPLGTDNETIGELIENTL